MNDDKKIEPETDEQDLLSKEVKFGTFSNNNENDTEQGTDNNIYNNDSSNIVREKNFTSNSDEIKTEFKLENDEADNKPHISKNRNINNELNEYNLEDNQKESFSDDNSIDDNKESSVKAPSGKYIRKNRIEDSEKNLDDIEQKSHGNFILGVLSNAKSSGLIITSDEFLNAAIRVMIGLICLMISLMNFVPNVASIIFSVASVLFCGFVIFRNAVNDVLEKNFFTENTVITVASIVSLIAGYGPDSTILLFIAEVGFYLRDRYQNNVISENEELSENIKGNKKISSIFLHTSDEAKKSDDKYIIYSKIYSTVLCIAAVVIAVLSLIIGKDNKLDWVHRGLILFVAAFPVPIFAALSLPYSSGVNSMFKKGIVLGNCNAVNSMSNMTSIIFDMTGTICSSEYTVSHINPVRLSDDQLLYLAAYAEEFSSHPIALAIKEKAGIEIDSERIIKHHEEQGIGSIVQLVTSEIIAAGNMELMERLSVKGDIVPCNGTCVYISVGKTYVGSIEFSMNINSEAKETVKELRENGAANVAIITGDNTMAATTIGKYVGINEIYADCTPKDKYDRIKYISETQEKREKLGLVYRSGSEEIAKDIPDVSISIGDLPSGNVMPDVMIINKSIKKVADAISISKSIKSRLIQNAIAIIVCEIAVIVLGLLGIVGMWFAVIINVLLSIAVIFNSSSLNRKKRSKG